MIYQAFLFLLLVFPAIPASAAGVSVKFDPSKPEIGPFPTDFLTAPATNTKTARRVRMPQPSDCTAQPNACQEAFLLNDYDGFNIQARVRVSFSGAINPDTIRAGVILIARDLLTMDERGVHKPGDIIRLNQIVYDSATNTAFGKPDTAMDQTRRYLLVVTDAVKDTAGDAVEIDGAFTTCVDGAPDDYCKALGDALKASTVEGRVVAASLYTTMSATSWLERARDRLTDFSTAATPNPGQSLFGVTELRSIRWVQQVRTSGEQFSEIQFPLLLLQGIRGIYFGSYSSPNYLASNRTIEPIASNAPLPPAPAASEIHFHSFLPTGAKPEKGYPVVIYGHGLGDSRFGGPSLLASVFAADGMATIAISAAGHGGGPGGLLSIQTFAGTQSIAAPGRGADINNDGAIDSSEGCSAVVSSPLGFRDCLRQTVV
ncbi:MAG: Ig-like domain-containing protein, partial [Bryobacterales bacterium]|nr:Ig-like domain-containing protein [Bryobacterales bacterium]